MAIRSDQLEREFESENHRFANERALAEGSLSLPTPRVGINGARARRKRVAKCSSKKVFCTLDRPALPKLEASRASVKTGIAALAMLSALRSIATTAPSPLGNSSSTTDPANPS